MSTQFKADTVSGMQSSGQTCTITASATSGATSSKSVSDMTGLAVGKTISGTNVAAGSVIATADSTISATSSKVTTGAISGGTITVASDQYYLLLIKTSPGGHIGCYRDRYWQAGSGSLTLLMFARMRR